MSTSIFPPFGADFQDKIKEAVHALASIRVQGQAGGGLVTVEIDGNNRCTQLNIDPSLVKNHDREILEDLIKVAFNQAQDALKQKIAEDSARTFGNIDAIQQLLSKIKAP